MLVDHPLVVVGRDRRQALRNQVVLRMAGFDLDDVALAAKVIDRLNQQEFNPTVRAARKRHVAAGGSSFAFLLGSCHGSVEKGLGFRI